jgi:hypothetical protein
LKKNICDNIDSHPSIASSIVESEEFMLAIQKKLVVDEQGRPQEVIISWEQYQQIVEILGLDLDEDSLDDLRQAQQDRVAKNRDAYVTLDAIDE